MKRSKLECSAARRRAGELGLSLVEVLVTVTVLGVLVALAFIAYRDVLSSSEDAIAKESAERLNGAVWKYNQIMTTLTVAADGSGTADEAQIIGLLQTRNAVTMPGSPYIPSSVNFSASSDAGDHRLQWNGSSFEVIEPGAAGTGVVVDF